jgi:hypothetical protein
MINFTSFNKSLMFAAGLICLTGGLASLPNAAEASTITQILNEFSYEGASPYPSPIQTVGTYSFLIPVGEQIVAASLEGTFGNSIYPNSAAVDVFFDSLKVASCQRLATCYSNLMSRTDWLFTFDSSNFSLLTDGLGVLQANQTSETFTRLGQTTLTIQTAAIPTPAVLPGLIGLGLGMLRKRKAEAAESVNEA